jgi:hypothetical protein
MSKGIAQVPTGAVAEIETALAQCSAQQLAGLSPISRTLRLAEGMETLRKNLQGDLLANIKALANTKLGFLTDRPPGSDKTYADWQIRDCCIEAMIRGASVIGNEFNIIAGTCYLTKEFFERALREWPGLSHLRLLEGVPTTATAGCLVPYHASWEVYGVPDELHCDHNSDGDFRIPVRVNAGMGVDAILGKAKRKMLARIFSRLRNAVALLFAFSGVCRTGGDCNDHGAGNGGGQGLEIHL